MQVLGEGVGGVVLKPVFVRVLGADFGYGFADCALGFGPIGLICWQVLCRSGMEVSPLRADEVEPRKIARSETREAKKSGRK